MTYKPVSGIAFREDDAFIEPDQKTDFFLVKNKDVKGVEEISTGLARSSKENLAL